MTPDLSRTDPQAVHAQLRALRAALDALPAEAKDRLAPAATSFEGAAALLGLHLTDAGQDAEREGRRHRVTVGVRRHAVATLPETAALMGQVAQVARRGLSPDLGAAAGLLEARAAAIRDVVLAAEEMRLLRAAPELPLDLRGAPFDPAAAVRAFEARVKGPSDEPGAAAPDPVPRDLIAAVAPRSPARAAREAPAAEEADAVFADYAAADLPEADRRRAAAAIAAHPALMAHGHDELIALLQLRRLVMRVARAGRGAGAAPLGPVSKPRRIVLWAAPRLGLVKARHPQVWRALACRAEGADALVGLRRFDQGLRDVALVPGGGGTGRVAALCPRDPLVAEFEADAEAARLGTHAMLAEIGAGPGAIRFGRALLDPMPGPRWDLSDAFARATAEMASAASMAGIGGRAERERAIAHVAERPAPRPADAASDPAGDGDRAASPAPDGGLLSAIRDVLAR